MDKTTDKKLESTTDSNLHKHGFVPCPVTLKKPMGIALAALIVTISVFMPESTSLTHQGCMAIGVLLACVALWFCGTFPQSVTAILGQNQLRQFLRGIAAAHPTKRLPRFHGGAFEIFHTWSV